MTRKRLRFQLSPPHNHFKIKESASYILCQAAARGIDIGKYAIAVYHLKWPALPAFAVICQFIAFIYVMNTRRPSQLCYRQWSFTRPIFMKYFIWLLPPESLGARRWNYHARRGRVAIHWLIFAGGTLSFSELYRGLLEIMKLLCISCFNEESISCYSKSALSI